jgi:glycosyltransferase involved in cell wall biosynthesis
MTAHPVLRMLYAVQNGDLDLRVPEGPQLHVLSVHRELVRRGHEVRVLSRVHRRLEWTLDALTWRDARPGVTNRPAYRLVERGLRRVQSTLSLPYLGLFDSAHFADGCLSVGGDQDIVYERYGPMGYGGLLAARRLGIPFVLEVNGDPLGELSQYGPAMSRSQWRILGTVTRRTLRAADAIVTVGETLRRRIAEIGRLPLERITVIPNGADVELFTQPRDASAIRGRYGLGDGPLVVWVGGFQPWHDAPLLVRSFGRVVEDCPGAVLALIGDGPERPQLVDEIRSLGLERAVRCLGRLPHEGVAELVSIADIATVVHRPEAATLVESPLKLAEYMAAGRAIVAPDVPHMRRILHGEDLGTFYAIGDGDSLAVALTGLLQDDRRRAVLGGRARAEAIERYSWAAVARQIEALAYRLVADSRQAKRRPVRQAAQGDRPRLT